MPYSLLAQPCFGSAGNAQGCYNRRWMEHLRDTKRLDELEDLTLAPYAVHSRDSLGREHDEPVDPSRTPFQRDWHRITHCRAFRKLEFKTQVFVHGEGGEHGDVVRNRLTHTLECTQIATSIARSLGLNEDLANAVALAHDLGHTPFGHSGELELKELVPSFNHNVHSLRIVRELEMRYPAFPGLNLTRDTLEGIEKHETEYDQIGSFEFSPGLMPPLEAQVASVADTIAFKAHDVEDSLVSGVLCLRDFDSAQLRLWREAFEPLREIDRPQVQMAQLSRRLIHLMISDVRAETVERLQDAGIVSLQQVREFKGNPVHVLAAYNAGENAVKGHNGAPPFQETRAYVPKVLAAWQVARGLCITPPDLISDGCVLKTGEVASGG